jgi:hypothetical protein
MGGGKREIEEGAELSPKSQDDRGMKCAYPWIVWQPSALSYHYCQNEGIARHSFSSGRVSAVLRARLTASNSVPIPKFKVQGQVAIQ